MKRPTRVQVYEGLYRSQADERFKADAAEAARHGWRPVEGFWNGEELSVTYVHAGPGWRDRAPADVQLEAPRSRGRTRVRTSVLLLATLAALLAIALVAAVGDIRRFIPA